MTASKLKVMTIVGTRPEVIRLSRVMPALDDAVDHIIVHTGQNYDYELNQIFFDELRLRTPDHVLDCAGETPSQTIGQAIIAADRVIAEERPDALLVLGDTNSCLACIPAKRRQVGPSRGSARRTFSSAGPRKLAFSGVATSRAP